jgi:uncharacterized protein (TIGR01777 family)
VKVFLTGATGFIGTALVRALAQRGEECVVLSRGQRNPWPDLPIRMIRGNPVTAGPWEMEVDGAGAVINLAGERIVDPPLRWTQERKRRLRASRVETTRNLVAAIRLARQPPPVLVSASAIGFYGARGDDLVDETTPPGDDFLARLVVDWEAAARQAESVTRVVLIRSGVVLGKEGGGLWPLMLLFKLGLGGAWGDGRQWWSWIHLADEIGLIQFALTQPLRGPVNLTAPNPVTVEQFAAALAGRLRRPALFRMPAPALRLALGEAADALLNLQRVVPKYAAEAGYAFRFPTIEDALAEIF